MPDDIKVLKMLSEHYFKNIKTHTHTQHSCYSAQSKRSTQSELLPRMRYTEGGKKKKRHLPAGTGEFNSETL